MSDEKKDGFEPTIVGFLCNWCTYAAADVAGSSRLQYPHNVRAIRTMCSGSVDPLYILRALFSGADAVLIGKALGQHPGRVVLHTALGARRVVTMLMGEQLPRIC